MTKEKFNSNNSRSESKESSSKEVLDLYKDHIDSFYDSILVQEAFRRKELNISFSQVDAEAFLIKICNALAGEIERSIASLDTQKYDGFKNPLIEKAKNEGKKSIINLMKKTSIEEAISEWLLSLSSNTRKGYERGIRAMIDEGFIRLTERKSQAETHPRTLVDFSNVPHDLVLEKIFSHPTWSPSIKTRNGTSYKNFIKFLEGKTEGIITFLRIKPQFPKNSSPSPVKELSADQIKRILSVLKDENPRDYCLVYLYLSSDLKLCKTLQLRKKDINFKNLQITFSSEGTQPSKTRSSERIIKGITLLLPNFENLRENDYLFQTRKGKPIDPMQITRTLQRTFKKIGIPPISLHDLKKISRLHRTNF